MAKRNQYTQEQTQAIIEFINEYIEYNQEEGRLYWKKAKRGITVGRPCGRNTGDSYIQTMINRQWFSNHHLIWLIEHNEWPKGILDHRDGNKRNNHISNLRETTYSGNSRNCKKKVNNTSGVTGVVWHPQYKKWWARINIDGKTISLGMFDCKYLAGAARRAAERENGYTPRHGK